ncbi:Ig-like domain-containing protein [Ammoniphilus sp. CFH 90114]|uniref:cadherin-like domain-containing protein n=1 Tax=Ammoniphilus sp. CFH 90114 TaxID=2493665 RepID=UPI00100F74FB|nr:Ig-like domain-containing protein [Ammoniphilus sp. CFH 90114]RXT04580.1 DNRLRE domain-containing protein [Ammoniphilus sp. CFH 90114]
MRKKLTKILLTSTLLLSSFLGELNLARAATILTPTTDGYWSDLGVVNDQPSNYVGTAGDGSGFGAIRSALQFNLTGMTGQVKKATLRIFIQEVYDLDSLDGTKTTVTLYGSTDDDWTDNPNLDSFPMKPSDQTIGTVNDNQLTMGWKEFDVTAYVQNQANTNFIPSNPSDLAKIVSFALTGNETNAGHFFSFAASEDPTYRPQLVLEVGPAIPVVAKSPVVTSTTTWEDVTSTSGLVITPNSAETETITHYKINGITGGTLSKQDGTRINDNDFITSADGASGLRFLPNEEANSPAGDPFTFNVYASKDAAGTGLSIAAPAAITVYEVNDAPRAENDTLISIPEDSVERVIPFSDLLANDRQGPSNENGQSLTIKSIGNPTGGAVRMEGATVLFTPSPNYSGTASFSYTIEDNGTTRGGADPLTDQATVNFTVTTQPDSPSVTKAVTNRDTLTSNGLVITRNAADGAEVTHFKITGITGGTVYKNDGTTPIANGDFITVSEGEAGLKFMPAANMYGATGFGFLVQASQGTDGTKLSSEVTALIEVIQPQTVTSVQVSPTTSTVFKGGTQQFSAIVEVLAGAEQTVTWASNYGKVTVDANGLVSVASDAAAGEYTITATSTFDGSKRGSATITVPNRAPVAQHDYYNTYWNTPLQIEAVDGVLKNDQDADGDELRVELVDDSTLQGQVTLTEEGSFQYRPSEMLHGGVDQFTYHIFDGQAYSSPATVSIFVYDTLSVDKQVRGKPTETVDVPIRLTSAGNVAGLQFDLDFNSNYVSLASIAAGGLLTGIDEDRIVTGDVYGSYDYYTLKNGKTRVIVTNLDNTPIGGEAGILLHAKLQLKDHSVYSHLSEGYEIPIQIGNIVLADRNENELSPWFESIDGSIQLELDQEDPTIDYALYGDPSERSVRVDVYADGTGSELVKLHVVKGWVSDADSFPSTGTVDILEDASFHIVENTTYTVYAEDEVGKKIVQRIHVMADADFSKVVDVTDWVAAINYVLERVTPSKAQRMVVDMNGDKQLNVIDPVIIANIIMAGGYENYYART